MTNREVPPPGFSDVLDEELKHVKNLNAVIRRIDEFYYLKQNVLLAYQSGNLSEINSAIAGLFDTTSLYSAEYDQVILANPRIYQARKIPTFKSLAIQARLDFQANNGKFSESFLNDHELFSRAIDEFDYPTRGN